MKGRKKVIMLLVAVLIVGSTLMSTGFAQTSAKTIKGWFDNNIKLYNNGQPVYLSEPPIIHQKPGATGGTTYVAVRDLSQLLGKNVAWDQASYSVQITDGVDESYQTMLKQILEREEEIVELKAKVEKLEKELKNVDKVSTLGDLEKYVNDRNKSYGKVDFEIILSGSTKSVTVKIYEMRSGSKDFESLYTSEIKSYLEDIISDIISEFKDADITGYIENIRGNKVVEFSVNSRGNLVLDADSSGNNSGDIRYLEEDLNRYHGKYERIDFEIFLIERSSSIEVDVYVDELEWKDLTNSDQEIYLERLYDDIIKEFKTYEIYGTIFDSYYGTTSYDYDMYKFDFDSSGRVTIR